MVELNSERLKKSYLNFIAVKNMVSYVQNESYRRIDNNFLTTIGFPYVGQMPKKRKEYLQTTFDDIVKSIDEIIIIGIVADFEKIIFDRLENAIGDIKKIVKSGYSNKPFLDYKESFVKTSKDIDKLSVLKAIIAPKLDETLARKFSEIIDYRNRLAHGKRFGGESLLSFDEIAETLDNVLNFV